MSIKIDLLPEVEAAFRADAKERRTTPETLLTELLHTRYKFPLTPEARRTLARRLEGSASKKGTTVDEFLAERNAAEGSKKRRR